MMDATGRISGAGLRRRLGPAAALGLAVLALGCGRRLDLPAEPDASGTPSGEVAYILKYRWDGLPRLDDLVLARGQVLFGVADTTRVLSWFSDAALPRENVARSLPEDVRLGGDGLQHPVRICEGTHNRLWVAYTRPHPTLVQFDLATTPPTLVDSAWVRQDSIRSFGGIAADPDSGYVYVADAGRSTITKYAPTSSGGRRVAVLATPGNGDHFVQQPHGLHFFQDSLLVADTGKNWLQVLDADVPASGRGQVIGSEAEPLQLRGPRDVWMNGDGFYYVADTDNARVLKLTRQGIIKEVVTELDPESSSAPNTLVATSTLVWVVDPGRNRLNIYRINTTSEELP